MKQAAVIDSLQPDPVEALVLLTGAGKRTCERWASGAASMPEHLLAELAKAIVEIDEAEATMRQTGHAGTILQIAAGRFDSEPLV